MFLQLYSSHFVDDVSELLLSEIMTAKFHLLWEILAEIFRRWIKLKIFAENFGSEIICDS